TAYMADWMKTGEEFLIVGDGFLLAYGGGYSVIHIPEGVKYIGPYAFAGHKGITTVYLPSSLETIEEGAFSNCTNLTAVEGGDNLTAIKDRAFYNCPIAAYTVSGTVQTIGLGAFANDADHESERSLVFAGEQIPALSYETTATRLTNADYRIAPLEGVDMAILAYPEQDLTGTVLQDGPFGYSGSFPDGGPVKDVSTNDSASGDVPVADDPVAEVSSGTEGAQSASGTVSHVMAGSIAIENNSLLLAEQFSYAKVEGATDGFILKIEDTAEEDSSLQTAYYRTYGEGLPANCIKANISLYESSGTVPVTRLGTQDISISMNVPDTLYSGKLHVVALDANGQLEELPYTRSNDTGTKSSRITFRTNHFSQFGFYSVGGTNYGTAVVSGGKAIFSSPLDDSPDTGDVIHPKWFLVLGLIFAGIALILAGSLGTRKRGML
ncbi:MAG: leucine-rich repeat domain-containing protein, partial [Lachnospiraceae bacterium]|nr:leucine-rich repeat domain-containing protein [Lachnospiraceae bacterium]